MPKRFRGRSWALQRIAQHAQPRREAARLVRWFESKGIYSSSSSDEQLPPDLSDVQELRVKLIRQRFPPLGDPPLHVEGWCPSDPQYRLLCALERDVVRGVGWTEFHERTAVIVKTTGGLLLASYYVEHARSITEGRRSLVPTESLPDALRLDHDH